LPAEVAAHLAACPECARALAAVRLARGLVASAARGVEPPPGFAARVMAAVGVAGRDPRRQGNAGVWRPAWALVPAFGCVVAALVVATLPGGDPAPAVTYWPGFGAVPSAGERLVIEADAPDQDVVLAAVLENGR
jgi:anti-sigma factor RsiW